MKTYTLKCTECGHIWKADKEPELVEVSLNEYCPLCDSAEIDILEIK